MSLLTSPRFALAAALIGAGLMAVPAAHAFTFQDEGTSGSDQSFLYPDRGAPSGSDQSAQGFDQNDGATSLKEGDTTLHFGYHQSFNRRYSTEHLFDPLGHPPGVR